MGRAAGPERSARPEVGTPRPVAGFCAVRKARTSVTLRNRKNMQVTKVAMKPSTDRLAVYRGGAHAAAVSPVGPAFTAVPGCPGAGKKRNPNRAIGTGQGVGARSASPVSAPSRRTWPGE